MLWNLDPSKARKRDKDTNWRPLAYCCRRCWITWEPLDLCQGGTWRYRKRGRLGELSSDAKQVGFETEGRTDGTRKDRAVSEGVPKTQAG